MTQESDPDLIALLVIAGDDDTDGDDAEILRLNHYLRPKRKNPQKNCLELRFSHVRTNPGVFTIGTATYCEVKLPDLEGVAPYHALITFDKHHRLVLQSIHSDGPRRFKTAVTYGDTTTPSRFGFTWILSGDNFFEQGPETMNAIVSLGDRMKFQVISKLPTGYPTLMRDEISQFSALKQQMASLPGLKTHFLAATLNTAPFQRPPSSDDAKKRILIKYGLSGMGEGGQGTVIKVWDVSSGESMALKVPQRGQLRSLREEYKFLKDHPHPHVVKTLGFYEADAERGRNAVPSGMLMELAPGGSADDLSKLTSRQVLDILLQILEALKHLHSRRIVHRDIKPANILVFGLEPIEVKLSDFGLAKEDNGDLLSHVGTRLYDPWDKYDDSVQSDASLDIWSLGVTILEKLHGIPEWSSTTLKDFNIEIIDKAGSDCQTGNCIITRFLARHMLLLFPKTRSSAIECLEVARRLQLPECCNSCCCRCSIDSNVGCRDRRKTTRKGKRRAEESDSDWEPLRAGRRRLRKKPR